jgi:hypothetical protein
VNIECKYIVDECNQRIAVQLDIVTFEKIEDVLENYALARLMDLEVESEDTLDRDQALAFYKNLEAA